VTGWYGPVVAVLLGKIRTNEVGNEGHIAVINIVRDHGVSRLQGHISDTLCPDKKWTQRISL